MGKLKTDFFKKLMDKYGYSFGKKGTDIEKALKQNELKTVLLNIVYISLNKFVNKTAFWNKASFFKYLDNGQKLFMDSVRSMVNKYNIPADKKNEIKSCLDSNNLTLAYEKIKGLDEKCRDTLISGINNDIVTTLVRYYQFDDFKNDISIEKFNNYFASMEFIISECDSGIDMDIDEIIPDLKYIDTPENLIDYGIIYDKEEQIKVLKNQNATQEYIDILDQANEILTSIDNDSLISRYIENSGEISSKKRNEESLSFITENDSLNKIEGVAFEITNKDIMLSKPGENTESDVLKNLFPREIKIDDNNKTEIKNIFSQVEHINEGSNDKIITLRKKVENAIDSKDINQIKDSIKAYQEHLSEYDKLMKDVGNIGEKTSFPVNASYYRVAGIPIHIRKQTRNNSIVRALTELTEALKGSKVTIDDILNNPTKAIKDYFKERQKENPISKKLRENDLFSSLNGLFQNDDYELFREQNNDSNKIEKFKSGLDAISCLLPKEKAKEFNFITKAVSNVSTPYVVPSGVELFNIDDVKVNVTQNVQNLLYMNDSNRDINLIQDKKMLNLDTFDIAKPDFNRINYVKDKNTTPEFICERIIDLMGKINESKERRDIKGFTEDQEEVVKRAVKNTANELLSNFELNKDTKYILKLIKNDKINTISPQDIKSFKEVCKIQADKLAGMVNKNFGKRMEDLIALENEYNGRSRFWKIFGGETRRLGRAIDAIRKDLKEVVPNDNLFNRIHDQIKDNSLSPDSFIIENGGIVEKEFVDEIGNVSFSEEFEELEELNEELVEENEKTKDLDLGEKTA